MFETVILFIIDFRIARMFLVLFYGMFVFYRMFLVIECFMFLELLTLNLITDINQRLFFGKILKILSLNFFIYILAPI